jgi:hypothetical protein
MRGPFYGVSYPRPHQTAAQRTATEQRAREASARTAQGTLPALAYNERDAEARWLLDRETPGAFAKARAANRLRELNKHRTCYGCGGRGFCQCDPLTPEAIRHSQYGLWNIGVDARPSFD